MSKRGNIKEDMELKKVLITLFFIFFTKSLSAEIVNPNEVIDKADNEGLIGTNVYLSDSEGNKGSNPLEYFEFCWAEIAANVLP